MERFEYEITRHESDAFTQMVYFCSEQGECELEEIPADEPQALEEALNARGLKGWELVQLNFGKGGVLAFWKRGLDVTDAE